MFTGIIEFVGTVRQNTATTDSGGILSVEADIADLIAGESIAVNGVCLTFVPNTDGLLQFDLSAETCRCSTLSSLVMGDVVHLERAMLPTTRLGGHFVTGHVDTIAQILSFSPVGDCFEMVVGNFKMDDVYPYLIPKGSIALDGVSLTINTVSRERISVMLVPHTISHTHFGTRSERSYVNVEFDYLARVVAHQLRDVEER